VYAWEELERQQHGFSDRQAKKDGCVRSVFQPSA